MARSFQIPLSKFQLTVFFAITSYCLFNFVQKNYFTAKNNKIKFSTHIEKSTEWNKNGNLRTIKNVLSSLGHQEVNSTDDWDLLWSFNYVFEFLPEEMKNLKPHQRVNHFPGIPFITNKGYMTTHNSFPFLPAAFEFPRMIKEFKEFVANNSGKKFVRKNRDNRGVIIVTEDEIDFEGKDNLIYQEFIENPLLIDGRAFDVGVYILITSFDPLRIYRFNDNFFRFCPQPYHPFDPTNVDSYTINDSHESIFNIPPFKSFITDNKMSYKVAFETYLQSKGIDVEKIWSQVDNIVIQMLLKNEGTIMRKTEPFGKIENFFELVRFDFIIDADFKVILMEVNMSPNLTPERFEFYQPMYTKIVYDTLNCAAGVDNDFFSELPNIDKVTTNEKTCIMKNCTEICSIEGCRFCSSCLDETEIKQLQRSYREHQRKGGMMRIFPRTQHRDAEIYEKLTPNNRLSFEWFDFQCKNNKEFC